jgi:chemotaxis regulatin CheY-phosphate phosphatase CheZ
MLMTAEVVVMNKRGLALAADSAITSGSEGVQKVYNTANKLFSLSSDQPVGIMVYGAASFMEVPWDVIIKSYRDHLGKRKFDDLADYMEDLLNFLCDDHRFKNEEVEEIIVYRIFSDHLKRLVKDVEEVIAQDTNTVSPKKVTELLVDYVNENIKTIQNEKSSFLNIKYETFKKKYGSVINEVRDGLIMYDVPETLTERFYELAYEATKKDYFSRGSTGLVMVGYGEREIFPHLLNYRLEGFVMDQLKYKKLMEKRISYTSDKEDGTASVTAFAQREMVDSFIGGMEPNMEEVIFDIIAKVLQDYPRQIQKKLSILFSEEQVTGLEKLGKEVYESMEEAVKEYQQTNYVEPLLGVVRSLPKEELADMAETLVNLTSFKRRVTRATESVGPPIDVAIITKGDGFVWMKRKNYVNAEINAQF